MPKKVYERSFAYFLNIEREKLQNKFGINWDRCISETRMKNIISSILENPDLIMSKEEKYRWKNKIKYESGKVTTLQIFFCPELAQMNLRINKKINYYN